MVFLTGALSVVLRVKRVLQTALPRVSLKAASKVPLKVEWTVVQMEKKVHLRADTMVDQMAGPKVE